jgi:hypothetical protein
MSTNVTYAVKAKVRRKEEGSARRPKTGMQEGRTQEGLRARAQWMREGRKQRAENKCVPCQ